MEQWMRRVMLLAVLLVAAILIGLGISMYVTPTGSGDYDRARAERNF